jgi:serine/threonine protein kinase
MGMVYKARQSKLDRLVALKILPQETSSDSTFAERFTREARALARLNHSSIVTVYDFGQAGELSYFVMEFVDGANLRQLLRSGPIAPRDTLQIMSQICDALQYAHDEGIVHRDIKPENILRDKRGRVKIADFGIAKLLSRKTANYTLTGPWQVVGTFNYMAPEQIENPQKLDHRADIYSLGVMFYEMLTGGLPMGRFALPSQKCAIDRRIDEVVLRALEKEPERRYQHVRELKAAIDAFLATEIRAGSVSARSITATGPFADAPGSGSTVPPSQPSSTATWPSEFPSAIPVSMAREQIRQRLHGLANGLKAAGVIDCISWGLLSGGIAIAQSPQSISGPPSFWKMVGLVGFLHGVFTIIGARHIQKMKSYQWGVLSCYLAMIPCSPGFLLGLPMGIWTLTVLQRPEVRSAFLGELVPSPPVPSAPVRSIPVLTPAPAVKPRKKGFFRKMLGTTTGWAMILCIVGCYASTFNWVEVSVPWPRSGTISPVGANDLDLDTMFSVKGYEVGLGITATLVFGSLLFILLATGFMVPIPWWRPLMVFVTGAAVIITTLFSIGELSPIFAHYTPSNAGALAEGEATLVRGGHSLRVSMRAPKLIPPRWEVHYAFAGDSRSFETKDPLETWNQIISRAKISLREGGRMAIALGVGLVLLAALQFRGILMSRRLGT